MTKRWELHKTTIQELYSHKKLEDVRQIMIDKYGFKASIRAYKGRLIQWGCRKYRPRAPAQRRSNPPVLSGNPEPIPSNAGETSAPQPEPISSNAGETSAPQPQPWEADVFNFSNLGYRDPTHMDLGSSPASYQPQFPYHGLDMPVVPVPFNTLCTNSYLEPHNVLMPTFQEMQFPFLCIPPSVDLLGDWGEIGLAGYPWCP
ncbi:hypothetical protein GGS20DRAFT_592356 [Poronia punctata]|nr:hypothetical protein GGS20DRAFT_592356 [Poronia punctata]